MTVSEEVSQWHERLLDAALAWRKEHPEFVFNLRTGDPTRKDADAKGKGRLQRGYWFQGNDSYIFFGPFRPNDSLSKTKTIGFVIVFDGNGAPRTCYLTVRFRSEVGPDERRVYERIVEDLRDFEKLRPDDYRRTYAEKSPLESFQRFLSVDYPQMRRIIEQEGQAGVFVPGQAEFEQNLERIERVRDRAVAAAPIEDVSAVEDLDYPRNVIYYGPPGTGKTYRLTQLMRKYVEKPQDVDRETWLQNLVAAVAWRHLVAAVLADLGRPARVPEIRDHAWLQARLRLLSSITNIKQRLWTTLMTYTSPTVETVRISRRYEPFIFTKNAESEWALVPEWRHLDDEAAVLFDTLKEGKPATAATEVKRFRTVTFHPSYSYEDFVRGIRPVADEEEGRTEFRLVDGIFKRICDEARANPAKRYALFIDEINRANIAKVFGELITLIEPDKRVDYSEADPQKRKGLEVQLPGGETSDVVEPPFGVPANLDIYGTMNTADRSIALLDIALRRRFLFEEMPPNTALLTETDDGIDKGRLLARINARLEFLLDRDHRIGHAYLMNATDVDDLREVFERQIIPLLQEYFFDDFSRIAMVLATKADASPFVTKVTTRFDALFPTAASAAVANERHSFIIAPSDGLTAESFRGIYEDGDDKKDLEP